MLLSKEALEVNGIEQYAVEKKFYSKKNQVYKIKCVLKDRSIKEYVVKKYNKEISMEKEIFFLSKLKEKGVAVPHIYYIEKDYCIMEYLDGKNLLDVICEQERDDPLPSYEWLILKLYHWFKAFYFFSKEITGKDMIFKDVNLRNFIMMDQMYGIDFEECYEGVIEEDLGTLCAFILTYNPSFTSWKINFVNELLEIFTEKFSLNEQDVKKELKKSLEEIQKRRRQ